MITRYAHPTVTELWSLEWTYTAWLQIERAVLRIQRRHGIIPAEPASELISRLRKYHFADSVAVGEVQRIERTTKHDVAAFLQYIRDNETYGQWLHFGLTSSDLVDTAQGMRFREMYLVFYRAAQELMHELVKWTEVDLPQVGRTHGQPAEPTAIRARALHWIANLECPLRQVMRGIGHMQVAKLSGPVGTFAHNPPVVEQEVAQELGLRPMGAGASQIVPRTTLAGWASSAAQLAAACSKIATDLRLLNLTGEVGWGKGEGQVGSSAMPHKNNPIQAEQINGLARLAAGYATMLQPMDLWLERDISHSSVERVAVPDLWHVLLRTVEQTALMLRELVIHGAVARIRLEEDAGGLWAHKETLAWIRDGYGYDEAREAGLGVQVESYDLMGDARWFMRNYPAGR